MQRNLLLNKRLSYSVRRYFVDEFFFRQVESLSDNISVLDLGGHRHPKRGQFDIDAYDFHVITANIVTEKGVTVQTDANFIPFADGSFDVVICAELLEHVPGPLSVLQEVYRVLRCGGQLLITAPFLYRIHGDPHDYGRYTPYYWRQVLTEAEFADIAIEHQGLFYSVLMDYWKQYLNHKQTPRYVGRAWRWIVSRWMVFPLQRWSLWRERRLNVRENAFLSGFTTGFGVTAVKNSVTAVKNKS